MREILGIIKKPSKSFVGFLEAKPATNKKSLNKNLRKWEDVPICKISGFYLNVYYLLSNSPLKINFWSWREVKTLYQTSTEVLRRSPQWTFNTHTLKHKHTHKQTQREREREKLTSRA